MQLQSYIVDIVVLLSIITAILVIIFRKQFNEIEQVFGYYIIINAIFEILALAMNMLHVQNNLPGLHLYTLIEFVTISIFFNFVMKKMDFKWPFKLITSLGVGLIVLNSLFVQSIFVYNSYSKSLVELFCIGMSILFYTVLLRSDYDREELKPSIYFVTGVFLSSAISCGFYLYSNKILSMQSALKEVLWSFNIFSNLMVQLIIIAGIYTILKRVNYSL